MSKTINVGTRLFKHSFSEALRTAKSGDTLLFDSGVYEHPDVIKVNGLTFKGNGTSPDQVIIKSNFAVNSGAFKIDNLTIVGRKPHTDTINVDNSSLLTINQSIIKHVDNDSKYSAISSSDSDVDIHSCSIYQTGPKALAVGIYDNTHVDMDNSEVEGLDISNASIDIATAHIKTGITCQNHGGLNAEQLTLTNDDFHLGLIMMDSSSIGIDNLNIPQLGKHFIDLFNQSVIYTKNNNLDSSNQLIIYKDDTSKPNIKNATVRSTYGNSDSSLDDNSLDIDYTLNYNSSNDIFSDDFVDNIKNNKNVSDEPKDTYPNLINNSNNINDSQNNQSPKFDNQSLHDAIDKLDALIGLDNVKKSVHQFINMAKYNRQREDRGLPAINSSLHSLFIGNPGTGKTTVARLVAKAMYQEGVMPKNNYVEVSRNDLVAKFVGATASKTNDVLQSALGGVLFIDEAYTLYSKNDNDYGQEAVDTILKFMEDHRKDIMIIFAGYTNEMEDFINMNPGLKSRIPNIFKFEDYSADEIAKIGILELKNKQYDFDEAYYTQKVKSAYKNDLDHSNGRWVRNFNDDLLRIVANNSMDDPSHGLTSITNDDMDQLSGGSDDQKHDEVNQLLNQLNSMTGLDNVKQFVNDLVTKVKTSNKLKNQLPTDDKPTYHMVFSGNPGTGKTTVARIIAKLFYNLGILPKNTVTEVSRSDLVGSYTGQSEEKTRKIIRNSMGGVLFIDEAYQLSNSGDANDFGKQVIDTLLPSLENYRDKFVVIFAGYQNEMEQFLNTNPGLRSRVPLKINFPSYNDDEIAQIVNAMVTKDWMINSNLLESAVKQKYSKIPEENRSNARWARNYVDQLISQHEIWLSNHQPGDVRKIDDSTIFESLKWDVE